MKKTVFAVLSATNNGKFFATVTAKFKELKNNPQNSKRTLTFVPTGEENEPTDEFKNVVEVTCTKEGNTETGEGYEYTTQIPAGKGAPGVAYVKLVTNNWDEASGTVADAEEKLSVTAAANEKPFKKLVEENDEGLTGTLITNPVDVRSAAENGTELTATVYNDAQEDKGEFTFLVKAVNGSTDEFTATVKGEEEETEVTITIEATKVAFAAKVAEAVV